MRNKYLIVLAISIFFLFLIQMAGTLVESIYILDLMNTSLDAKVLGLLFFFTPALLVFYRTKHPREIVWILVGLLFLARGLTPYLNTLGRMLSSGISTGAALTALPFLLSARQKDNNQRISSFWISAGLALGVGLSVLLRTLDFGLDYSLLPEGGWAGWILGICLVFLPAWLDWGKASHPQTRSGSRVWPVLGIYLVVGLAWFAFSAPAVIARWTEGDYRLIVSGVSLLTLVWAGLFFWNKDWFNKPSRSVLLIWNLLFTVSLTVTILAHRVSFPAKPDSPVTVVGGPSFVQQLPLLFMLLLFPVIYLDLELFTAQIHKNDPAPRDLLPGSLLGGLILVLLVFSQIFSNVWGYVEPVSLWFRNKFWLPYLVMGGLITLLAIRQSRSQQSDQPAPANASPFLSAAFLGVIFLATGISALLTTRIKSFDLAQHSLKVMTFNIQGANDDSGERSYRDQLALIQQVDPDILALQESDTLRVSLNNNDYVRYYAGRLGYYSYFGPTTVSGTFGTAILSKYPLENTRTVFSFSDQDEIGTAEAQIQLAGRVFTIYDVHPDGSDQAMLIWAQNLLDRAKDKQNVIALGDYNLRDYEEAYQLIDQVYTNAWVSIYPSKISPDGTDMSGENRIDHIFISPSLMVRDPVYILPPASATDHAVHWCEIFWKD